MSVRFQNQINCTVCLQNIASLAKQCVASPVPTQNIEKSHQRQRVILRVPVRIPLQGERHETIGRVAAGAAGRRRWSADVHKRQCTGAGPGLQTHGRGLTGRNPRRLADRSRLGVVFPLLPPPSGRPLTVDNMGKRGIVPATVNAGSCYEDGETKFNCATVSV